MPSKTYVNPDTMAQPTGYTHVVKVGNTAYIAGQVSIARDGSVVGKGDPETQARQIWHNLEAAVKSVGGTLNNIRLVPQ
jgi:enamine deaminase RidA (YjgF/YER057c/UK114 family)